MTRPGGNVNIYTEHLDNPVMYRVPNLLDEEGFIAYMLDTYGAEIEFKKGDQRPKVAVNKYLDTSDFSERITVTDATPLPPHLQDRADEEVENERRRMEENPDTDSPDPEVKEEDSSDTADQDGTQDSGFVSSQQIEEIKNKPSAGSENQGTESDADKAKQEHWKSELSKSESTKTQDDKTQDSATDYDSMKDSELVAELKKRDLSTSGKRSDFINRLKAHDKNTASKKQ